MKNLSTLSLAQLVDLYNQHSDKPVKKFRDKPTAIARVEAVLPKAAKAAKSEVHRSMSEFHAERVAAKRAVKIKVLVKGNPKRGTAAQRYDLYKNGMTIGEYINKGGQLRDVIWDAKQGWIELR